MCFMSGDMAGGAALADDVAGRREYEDIIRLWSILRRPGRRGENNGPLGRQGRQWRRRLLTERTSITPALKRAASGGGRPAANNIGFSSRLKSVNSLW